MLVRSDQPEDELSRLRARVAELEAVLDARAADADRIERELDMFAAQYQQQVGTLHEQLDQLELDIAEAELGELSKQVAQGRVAPDFTPPPSMAAPEPAPRFTSDAVRKLFRDVARTIHPDLARDELTRDRRHTLMVEANRAYALGDEERLRRILQAWEDSPEAVVGSDTEAMRQRLIRRIAQIEAELEACAGDVGALKESPLWKLKVMVDQAAGKGKNLVGDMVKRLKRDIMVANNRLDAIRPRP